jgi:carbon storage regulator
MLVLGRKLNEGIVINGNIRVSIARIDGMRVSLGVEAPSDIPVHRDEVQKEIEERNGKTK